MTIRKERALNGKMYHPYLREMVDLYTRSDYILRENVREDKLRKTESMDNKLMDNLDEVNKIGNSCKISVGSSESKRMHNYGKAESLLVEAADLFDAITEFGIKNSWFFLGRDKGRLQKNAKEFRKLIYVLLPQLAGCGADLRMVQNKRKDDKKDTREGTLPLVILRPAISIALKMAEKRNAQYPNRTEISAAIAIATANGQRYGYLFKGTQKLTKKGKVKELEHAENLDEDKLALFEYGLYAARKETAKKRSEKR